MQRIHGDIESEKSTLKLKTNDQLGARFSLKKSFMCHHVILLLGHLIKIYGSRVFILPKKNIKAMLIVDRPFQILDSLNLWFYALWKVTTWWQHAFNTNMLIRLLIFS